MCHLLAGVLGSSNLFYGLYFSWGIIMYLLIHSLSFSLSSSLSSLPPPNYFLFGHYSCPQCAEKHNGNSLFLVLKQTDVSHISYDRQHCIVVNLHTLGSQTTQV